MHIVGADDGVDPEVLSFEQRCREEIVHKRFVEELELLHVAGAGEYA